MGQRISLARRAHSLGRPIRSPEKPRSRRRLAMATHPTLAVGDVLILGSIINIFDQTTNSSGHIPLEWPILTLYAAPMARRWRPPTAVEEISPNSPRSSLARSTFPVLSSSIVGVLRTMEWLVLEKWPMQSPNGTAGALDSTRMPPQLFNTSDLIFLRRFRVKRFVRCG